MQELRLLCLQADLHWQDFQANRQHMDRLLASAQGQPDVIILPEMFGSGFTMQPETVAQEMEGEAVQWMRDTAGKRNATLMGSLVIREGQHFLNRLVCAEPDGTINYYDKRHLFSYAGEHEHYTAGNHHLLITIKGWRIMTLICYDLRFPVWSRNVWNYDLLVYVANWPVQRIDAWKTLLKARAIENQAYVAGVNRVGTDPNGNVYSGQSVVYDMTGNILHACGESEETPLVVLDNDALTGFRGQFAFLQDRDRFYIESEQRT